MVLIQCLLLQLDIYYVVFHQQHQKYGSYVIPIQSFETRKDNKDLIAIPLCHMRYNSETTIDESLVKDSFITCQTSTY